MAKNDYVITIKNATQKKSKSPIAGSNNSSGKDTSSKQDSKITREQAAGYFAYKRFISPFVKQALSYEISTVSLKTGRAEYQQRLQFAYDVAGKVAGLGENIALGFLLSGGNPLGAVVGAAVSLVHTAVTYAQNSNTINLNKNLENVSIGLMDIRAGGSVASYSSSRRERQ